MGNGVVLQGNYRRSANPTVSVPAPPDGRGDPWFYNRLAFDMHEHGKWFRNFQLPPGMKTIGGASATSDGYGPFWEYDWGSVAEPTRFGHLQDLRRACAMGYANNCLPMADWVPHQRYGGNNGVYEYNSWAGPKAGRFPKSPQDFRKIGNGPDLAPQDPVFDRFWDIAFGDELSPEEDLRKGYLLEGLQKAGHWMYRTQGLVGTRDDDIKGQSKKDVTEWANYGAMAQHPVIGEYAEGNKNTLAYVLSQLPANCYLFDFEVKYTARDMCNNGSNYNMAQLADKGLMSLGWPWSMRGANFIENADSDTNGFGAVVFNKLLGYAWMLTSEGWPFVYYRDYALDKYCYGLKPDIDNLIWVHEKLANGPTLWRHKEFQFVVYERTGAPGLLVGLNNDIWGGWKKVPYMQTSFGAHQRIHDYAGHAGDLTTDGNGGISNLWLPPNKNGAGYVAYSREGLDGALPSFSLPITQLFEGSGDLLQGPALIGGNPVNEQIYCEANTALSINKESGTGVHFEVVDPHGNPIVPRGSWRGRTDRTGWHTIIAYSAPDQKETDYEFTATYKAPQTMPLSELV